MKYNQREKQDDTLYCVLLLFSPAAHCATESSGEAHRLQGVQSVVCVQWRYYSKHGLCWIPAGEGGLMSGQCS